MTEHLSRSPMVILSLLCGLLRLSAGAAGYAERALPQATAPAPSPLSAPAPAFHSYAIQFGDAAF